MLCYKRSGISSVKTESELEIHLFEPHSIIQNKYFNVDRETPAKTCGICHVFTRQLHCVYLLI